jgi:primary-amine oxidase
MCSNRLRKYSWLVLSLALAVPRLLGAGEVSQHFPADLTEPNMRTKWRVVWGIENHAGGSKVLYIKAAYFTRVRGGREIQVLGDSRLTEIFVPYIGGTRIYDISGFNFQLIPITPKMLGPACITPGQIYGENGNPAETGPVAKEVHDDNLRWINSAGQSRRGQEMLLWSVLSAGNYRYIMLYVFRDDGQVSFRLGATSHNLFSTNADMATHLHSGCWRINPALGNPDKLALSKVRYTPAGTVKEPLTKELRTRWNPEEFTRLRIESTELKNGHTPPSPLGYELTPMVWGIGRFSGRGEEFTLNDFWTVRDKPLENKCRDLNSYENGESLAGARPVLWHLATAHHSPRDEDFGPTGYDRNEGVALTSWAGFDLKPRNFFPSTPLYP